MNETMLADLKQFITATVAHQIALQNTILRDELKTEIQQATGSLRDELKTEIREGNARLESKIDSLATYVADALATSNEVHGEQLENHERRISRLEHKAA